MWFNASFFDEEMPSCQVRRHLLFKNLAWILSEFQINTEDVCQNIQKDSNAEQSRHDAVNSSLYLNTPKEEQKSIP